jgi:hypothetical protein
MVASNQEIKYDLPYIRTVADDYFASTSNALSPYRLFTNYVRDRNQILLEEAESPILSDLKPGLEYYFLNTPIRTRIKSKGVLEELVLNRITGCDTFCQQEIFELVE